MAAGGWNAAEVWNAVDIPFPSSTSLTVACTDLDSCIIDLHKACENAIRVLTDKSLTVELLVLHSIIYTFHNRLYRHKPYLVIKQVEQCAKRFQKMQLKHSIQSLINTCSSVTRKRRMVINCPKRVPNQPVLEWMSLKVLGGSKLILRLMDMCSKAFLLATQFLRYGRYIILNVVTMGMLSRLWFLFKRILIYLEVLYDKLVVAINKVSKIQPLPFVKDFSFPGSIKQWLGLSSIKGTLGKLPGRLSRKTRVLLEKPSLLDKLFSEEEEALLLSDDQGIQLDGSKVNYNNDPNINSRFLDIGVPVQGKRLCKIGTDGQFGFKMKFLQAQSRNFSTKNQNSVGEFSCKRKKKNEHVPLNEFLEKITAAQSFSVLSHELKTIFRWFRQRKLKHERCYFGNLYQKCHKLKMVECLGYSFPKKIKFIKSSVCKYLTKKFQRDKIFNYRLSRTTLLRKHKIRHRKQLKLCKIQSRRNMSLLKKYRRARLTAKKRSRKLHTIPHFDIDEQASVTRQSVTTDMSAEPVGYISPDQSLKNVPHPSRTESPVMLNVDDIDDIFASIGV